MKSEGRSFSWCGQGKRRGREEWFALSQHNSIQNKKRIAGDRETGDASGKSHRTFSDRGAGLGGEVGGGDFVGDGESG